MLVSAHCGDFVPSTHGWPFAATDLPSPPLVLTLNSGSQLSLDQVTATLAGGLCFAAADYYRTDSRPPQDASVEAQSALYAYLVGREIDSLDQPTIARIIATMNPSVPPYDIGAYVTVNGVISRARALLTIELPRIVMDLQRGYLVQLCLIEKPTSDARLLGESNHQVVAYGFDMSETATVLHVYDPMYPAEDNLTLTFATTSVPTAPIALSYAAPSMSVPKIAGFFYVPYAAKPTP